MVREDLVSLYSDLFKDVHGFRPRDYTLTEEQLSAEIESLSERLTDIIESERIHEMECVKQFEERLSNVIYSGAKDRETAIKWIHEAEGSNGDDDYLCFLLNLPYGYFGAK